MKIIFATQYYIFDIYMYIKAKFNKNEQE